ncbi:MAG: hypothetical protein RBR71_13295 [Gudongella sp.]|jgi:hypothetical protein|nr:hypothetical protein [Gudongella sp.]
MRSHESHLRSLDVDETYTRRHVERVTVRLPPVSVYVEVSDECTDEERLDVAVRSIMDPDTEEVLEDLGVFADEISLYGWEPAGW